jgi:hypothetical protein
VKEIKIGENGEKKEEKRLKDKKTIKIYKEVLEIFCFVDISCIRVQNNPKF